MSDQKPCPRPAEDPEDEPSAAGRDHTLDDALIGAIGASFAPVEPLAGRRCALRDRILARAAESSPVLRPAPALAPHSVTIRARDGGWIDFAPGLHCKLLFTDGRAETYLARIDPGTVVPPHQHPGIGECFVVEGRMDFSDGGYLDAGDYQACFAGSSQNEVRSPCGALVFLRYSEPLERYLST